MISKLVIPANTPRLNLDDIKTGLFFSFPRLREEEDNLELFHNNITSLYNIEPNDLNGLEMIGKANVKDIIKINWPRRITDTLEESLFSEPPYGVDEEIIHVMSEATKNSSIYGVGVIAAADGEIYSIDTPNYFPLFGQNRARVEGHMFVYPFNDSSYLTTTVPNKMEIVICMPDYKVKRVYDFNAQSLGNLVSEEPSSMCGVYTFGKGYSDYVDVKPILRELMTRITLVSKVLNRHSSPHMEGPMDAFDTGTFEHNTNGMFLPRTDDLQPSYKYIVWDANMTANAQQIDRLLDELHIATGLPATYFGISRVGGDSGVSRERQMLGLLQRVKRVRRQVEQAVLKASADAGLGITEISWVADPFGDFNTNAMTEVALVGAGISTVEESKERLFGGK